MKNYFYILALSSLAFGCGPNTETLEKEVFAIHDEIMPKMDKIMSLKSQISGEISELDSLIKIKADSVLINQRNEALELSSALEKADVGMMDWMHNYNGDTLKVLSGDEAVKYLEGQKKVISEVKELTNKSIEKAEVFVKKRNPLALVNQFNIGWIFSPGC